ncbi:MAG TPA: sigma-70 family RNA polymerase sigma factor [Acidimicrobiales bacterium]|jgi:RNA polymerase sigma-70 factor (ECF subfamily)|nr:sigma-70 family RNA polymerase sigma factor [Acidimicrobiales bacterium]
MTDTALLGCGDPEAWSQLYAETLEPLQDMARRRARPADAADAVAETYARALAGISRYRPDRPVAAWLAGILRNVLREQARRRDEPVGAVSVPVVEADEPLRHVLQAEDRAVVRRLLDKLDGETRGIVVLRVVEGRSAVEVGLLTGRAPASVRMVQSRAVRRMRGHVE